MAAEVQQSPSPNLVGRAETTVMCSAGGEEQRVKPPSELHTRSPGRTIYILEEPTAGLRFISFR